MTYQEFLESLQCPKVHNISNAIEAPSSLDCEEACYLLSTSGSVSKKHYIFTLKAIKSSVLSFLKKHPLDSDDRWWVSLSTGHVAGFSILARSYFAKIKPPLEEPFELDPDKMNKEKISLLSLVPTQVFDIVEKALKAPLSLKYVFVGGASLSQELNLKAKALGWPIVQCFGSSETFAQFSSSTDGKVFEAYEGWSIDLNEDQELLVKGPSLFSYEVLSDDFIKERSEEWLNHKDKVLLVEAGFSFLEKSDGLYKHKGAYRNFKHDQDRFESLLLKESLNVNDFILLLMEEERSGAGLYVLSSAIHSLDVLFEKMTEIRGAFIVSDLKDFRSEIGKPIRSKIQDALLKPLLLV